MPQYPTHPEGTTQPVFHVIPDNIRGGWNVYSTMLPQEPQTHFRDREEAIAYAKQMSLRHGVGYVVEAYEAPQSEKPSSRPE